MRIAGVYASAFLLFGRKKNIFLQFKNCYVCTERRNKNFLFCKYKDAKQQRITPRYILSDWGTPKTKTNLFTNIQNSKIMKKVNQIATINDVSLNDKLKEWNEENECFRVQLRISYAADDSKDESDKDLLSLADFEEAGAAVGKTYTCLINFDSLLTKKHDERTQDEALKELSKKFVGKKARFSTFDFTINELTDGKEKAINDGTHTYSSLANTYLGNVNDEESEFNKLKNRMIDMVDGDFDYGQAD